MDTTGILFGAACAAAAYVLLKRRGGCGCGCSEGQGDEPAASGYDDDGPDSEPYTLGGAVERVQLFAGQAFAEAKGGCGCAS